MYVLGGVVECGVFILLNSGYIRLITLLHFVLF